MNLLSDAPLSITGSTPSALAPALVAIAMRPATMDQGAAVAAAPPTIELALPAGVVDSTLSERGEVLAAGGPNGELAIAEVVKPAAKPARRAPMQMVQRLLVMEAVRSAPADEPDSELAARLSLQIGRAIGNSTVKDYRVQLGLVSVPMPTKSALRAKLAELQAELAAAQQPSLPGL